MSITAERAAKILSGTGPPMVFDPSQEIAEQALIVEMKDAASIADLIRTQAARIAELEASLSKVLSDEMIKAALKTKQEQQR